MDLLAAAAALLLPTLTHAPSWVPPVTPLVVERAFSPPGQPWGAGHRGVDLAASRGDSVLSAGPGRVVLARWIAGRWVVAVEHPRDLAPLPPGSWRTTYEAVRPVVVEGASVQAGDPLGVISGGGHCTCLHWGLKSGSRYADPLALLMPGTVLKPVSLGARMGLLERRPQALDGDMGVHLRRGQARVPEQLLDRAQVRATLEHMRRRRVTQPVRPEVGHALRLGKDAMNDAAHRARVDALPALAQEDGGAAALVREFWATVRAPIVERARRRDSVRHDPLPPALAEDAQRAPARVEVVDVKPAELRDADAGGVEEFDDRPIAQAAR